MASNRHKAGPVRVTNPAASRLPSKRGANAATPATPEPWRPQTIPPGRQLRASERVKFTSEKASRSR
jgi:hypothetical protein